MLQCAGRLQDQPRRGGVCECAAGSPRTLAYRLQPRPHGTVEPQQQQCCAGTSQSINISFLLPYHF